MKTNISLIGRTILGFTLLLLLISLAGSSARAAPQVPITRRGVELDILPAKIPQSETLCRDTQLDFAFTITEQDLYVPVAGVEVSITDDSDGSSISSKTDGRGMASSSFFLLTNGSRTLTVTARKDGYLPDSMEFQYEVIECRWKMQVSWIEEYTLMESAPPKLGAAFGWQGIITTQPNQGSNSQKQLTSQTLEGGYRFFIRNQWIKPIKIDLEPSVDGQYTLLISGTADGSVLNLHIETMPVNLPEQVTVKLTDLGPNQLQINYQPIVPVLNNKGQCFETDNIQNIQIPIEGGHAIYVVKPCFLGVPKKADLTILLIPLEAGQSALPAPSLLAVLGGQP